MYTEREPLFLFSFFILLLFLDSPLSFSLSAQSATVCGRVACIHISTFKCFCILLVFFFLAGTLTRSFVFSFFFIPPYPYSAFFFRVSVRPCVPLKQALSHFNFDILLFCFQYACLFKPLRLKSFSGSNRVFVPSTRALLQLHLHIYFFFFPCTVFCLF